jgi:hypothetical protein
MLAVVLVVLHTTAPVNASPPDFVLIRNKKTALSNISLADARKLYFAEIKQWPSGIVVQVVLHADGSPENVWLSQRFGLKSKDLLTRIKQEVFRGEMKRPILVSNTVECVDAVKQHDGAVGVIPRDAISQLPPTVEVLGLMR